MIVGAAIGAVIGLALGLLGAGGSVLAVPALVYLVGQPLQVAIPTSLAVVAVSSLGGLASRARRSQVQWRIALVFGAAGIPAAFAGTALSRLIPQRWLLLSFAALMVIAAIRMLRGNSNTGGACRTREGGTNWRRCLPRAVTAGAGVGVLTGLFGVGGGFVIVPAMVTLLGLEAPTAAATSLVVILINSLAGLGAHVGAVSNLDYGFLLVFAGIAFAVSLGAGRLATRLPARTMRRWFAYIVVLIAAGVATAAVLNPTALG